MSFSGNGRKVTGILLALLACAAATLRAQEKPAAARPIAPLSWLVGGVWKADATKLGPGMKTIETRYQWADNDAFIRFTTHFVMEKGTVKNYDGNFFWNPELSALGFWYMDAANEITQGPVKLDGETMELTFRAADFQGKPADLRVDVVRITNDHYTWRLEEKAGADWKRIASLEYLRDAG
jgi:hypothetical protein